MKLHVNICKAHSLVLLIHCYTKLHCILLIMCFLCNFKVESVRITQRIPPKVHSNCPSEVSSLQEDILQILSTDFGVSPLGLSRQYPAQSCNEIHDANPSSTSGFYWIRAESAIQQYFCTFNFI